MNNQTQEALKMAIEALNKLARLGNGDSYGNSDGNCIAIKTLKAIEEALEQPAQEPVLYIDQSGLDGHATWAQPNACQDTDIPLYTHPHQWQGLTEDEITELAIDNSAFYDDDVGVLRCIDMSGIDFARAIEQALKEKNHVN